MSVDLGLGVLLVVMKATLLLGAGIAVASALRRAPAGTRHAVWLATVAGVLALPAMTGLSPMRWELLPAIPVSGLVAQMRPAVPVAAPRAAEVAGSPVSPARTNATLVAADAGERVWPRPATSQVLFAVWMAVGLALLARLAAGALAVRRIVATSRPLAGEAWQALLCDAADRLGLAGLPRLVSSDRIEMPFAAGMWRGTIVLPRAAEEWSDERRRLVLFHELAHIKRHDLLGHMLGRVACAAYWFHPLVWTAARRLRLESERACDDLVLACGTRASDYAGHLLEIVSSARRPGAPAAALAMARRTEFEGRMLAILDPTARRGGAGRFPSALLMAASAAVFLGVAALAPAPQAAAAAEPPTALPQAPLPAQNQPARARMRNELRQPEARAQRQAERRAEAEDEQDAADAAPTAEQTEVLARVLRTDADSGVRRSAAWALASSRDERAVEALAAALQGDADERVRETAAWALADSGADRASAALAAALKGDRSEKVRATAAWALAQRPESQTAALFAAAADPAPNVREAAIWALGNQHLDKVPAPVSAALQDAEPRVRAVAAWALSQIADPATAPALRAAFQGEKSEEVRESLFHALLLMGDRSPEIIQQLLESKDPELRGRAVQMLSRHRGPWPWPWPRPDPRPFP